MFALGKNILASLMLATKGRYEMSMRTNTLAYLAPKSMTKKISITPEPNVIHLFTAVNYYICNRLECL